MDINFLNKNEPPSPERGPSLRGFVLLLFLVIATLTIIGVALRMQQGSKESGLQLVTRLNKLFRSADTPLAGEKEDRINILLLGIGGEGHDGGNLTDTMILASLKPSTGETALLSFPRDLVVPIPPTNEWRKINSVHAYAEAAEKGSGGESIRRLLENLLQVPIPYYLRVDFQAFEKLIDDVGGITVTVENRLEDERYPIPGNEYAYPVEQRYEHLVFEKGTYTMDGKTALKYVRSRRGKGIEGSDFARIKRQQNILLAFKEKIFSWPTLTNPSRIRRIMNDLSEHIGTNVTFGQGLRLAQFLKTINPEAMRRITLSDAPESILQARIANGAYILEPRGGSFQALQTIAQNIFTTSLPSSRQSVPKAAVAILNGTNINGLGRTIGDILETQEFMITRIENAPLRSLKRTIIYDLTNGKEYLAYDRLRLLLDALPGQDSANPLKSRPSTTPQDQFLIILGENAKPK